ncbi:hypothetical protein HOY82DRAFT_480030 [Tuber indicum]|nr:hypothetical protein HOY82DRAFT_480030 [Tuber indicum]
MGNLCSRGEPIREMQIEIWELQNDMARLAKDREVPEVQAGGGRATVRGGSSSGIYHQATTGTWRSWPVGHFRTIEESSAAEEFVARVRRSRN